MHRRGQIFYLILVTIDSNREKEGRHIWWHRSKPTDQIRVLISNELFLLPLEARTNWKTNKHKKLAYFQIYFYFFQLVTVCLNITASIIATARQLHYLSQRPEASDRSEQAWRINPNHDASRSGIKLSLSPSMEPKNSFRGDWQESLGRFRSASIARGIANSAGPSRFL